MSDAALLEPDPERRARLTRAVMAQTGLDRAAIEAFLRAFYAAARADPLLAPAFAHVHDWEHHIATITDFWSSMLLGTGRYMGRPMPKHLTIPELTDAHFARWLRLFRETAETHCPPEIAALFIDRAERIAFSFRLRIAQFRGEDSIAMQPQRAGHE